MSDSSSTAKRTRDESVLPSEHSTSSSDGQAYLRSVSERKHRIITDGGGCWRCRGGGWHAHGAKAELEEPRDEACCRLGVTVGGGLAGAMNWEKEM